MEFRILGPLEVRTDDGALELRGQKQRALLALLLFEANRPVSRDRLIDALWEDEPTATAAKALQVYISQLRKQLGHDRLLTTPAGYLLRAAPDELDLARFRDLKAEGKLHDALALWRGPPLAEFGQSRFAQAEIARLEELHLACLESRIDADLADGRHADVIGELEALVQQNPLRERLRGLQVLALYRSGRQADALAAYQAARRALVDELGIEPGKELRELQRAILRQDPALVPVSSDEPSRGLFVGRVAELAILAAALDDALAGRGRLVLLVGEPGIGKSRLADETIRRARARGVQVLVGRCWEASGAPPFWPWVQSMRGYEGETPPELRGEPVTSDSDSARFRLFDATAKLLRTASRERPLLLFLDDLHAADEPSLLLLEFVARELGSMCVLIVGACRDVDPVPARPLSAMLAAAAREPLTTRLTLGGLSESDVAEYVALAAGELASAELTAALHEETDGNPLFLSETVRLLAIEGRMTIPPSLRDVIARRIAHLGDECNRVLQLASILGREFAFETLGRMHADDVLEPLDEAMTARVLADVPGSIGRLRFAHVLIRDTLYEGLTTARRIRLHRLAAETLEQLGAEPAELAHHWIAGHDFARGLEFARRAGDRALGLLAYEEAARLYDVALAAKPDEPGRCELLVARGEAEARAGDTPRAKETFVAAAEIARRLGLARELARAAVGYGGRIVWVRAGDDPALVPMLEEALAALPDGEHELRARALARLAGALRDDHARDRREALGAEAVALARRTGEPAALAYALDAYGYAILAPDTLDRCIEIARKLRAQAERAGDKERVVAGHMLAIMALAPRGEIAETWSELEAATRHAGELGQRPQVIQAKGIRAMLAIAEGRLAEGEALSAERYELGRQALREESIALYCCHRHSLHDFRGTIAEVETEIGELAASFPARPVFRCVLAHVHARVGKDEKAQDALRELPGALPFDQEWLYGMSLLAETAALLEDAEAAAVLYPMLLPWRELNAVDIAEGCRGAISRYLGLLAGTVGRPREAAEHFDSAIVANERMGFRPWLARTQHDYARLLGPDDARATALEAAALATYDEIGAVPASSA